MASRIGDITFFSAGGYKSFTERNTRMASGIAFKYVRVSYGIDIPAGIAASVDGIGKLDDRRRATRSNVVTTREFFWMHLEKEGRKLLKNKYPGEEVRSNALSDLRTGVTNVLKEKEDKELHRCHLTNMKQAESQRVEDILSQIKAQVAKCRLPAGMDRSATKTALAMVTKSLDES